MNFLAARKHRMRNQRKSAVLPPDTTHPTPGIVRSGLLEIPAITAPSAAMQATSDRSTRHPSDTR